MLKVYIRSKVIWRIQGIQIHQGLFNANVSLCSKKLMTQNIPEAWEFIWRKEVPYDSIHACYWPLCKTRYWNRWTFHVNKFHYFHVSVKRRLKPGSLFCIFILFCYQNNILNKNECLLSHADAASVKKRSKNVT